MGINIDEDAFSVLSSNSFDSRQPDERVDTEECSVQHVTRKRTPKADLNGRATIAGQVKANPRRATLNTVSPSVIIPDFAFNLHLYSSPDKNTEGCCR
jgi:hypothetical protein